MRVGIDIGGTFTDVITISDDGVVRNYKLPSTPREPSQAVIQALNLLANVQIAELVHGSTVATNTILERKGAKTALVTTDGFRDTIYIQRQNKTDVYNPAYRKPVPVVARDMVVEVAERIAHTGEIIIPLDVSGLKDKIEGWIRIAGIRSLAVSLLHSYKNPMHERELADFLERSFPELNVSISSEVLPEIREYERTSTTIISAYLKPVVANYIDQIESQLKTRGSRFLVMQSSGGILSGAVAKRHPAQMFLSGPAGGVTGAIFIGQQCGIANLFTLDVGGTSTDAALITAGTATVTTDMQIDGLPIALPMIDIATIGAGGGSIAWVDDGEMLRVGPQSAGADPGPACYGNGGQAFTVTDALVILGFVQPDRFLGGTMVLDAEASRQAARPLSERLKLQPTQLAESVFEINLASVTQAMRLVSIERGLDPRDYTICAFGGGGPLHAAIVAEELGIDKVIVPPHAGLFSAYGLLVADFRRDYVLTEPMEVRKSDPTAIHQVLMRLQKEGEKEFSGMGFSPEELTVRFTADMRYVGQGHNLNVPLEEGAVKRRDVAAMRSGFDHIHLEKYGHNFPDDPVEFVSFRAHISKSKEKPHLRPDTEVVAGTGQETAKHVHWKGEIATMRFLDRHTLDRSSRIAGPVVIAEPTATTYLPVGWELTIDEYNIMHMTKDQL